MGKINLNLEGIRFECQCWEGTAQKRQVRCARCGGRLSESVTSDGKAHLTCLTTGCLGAIRSFAAEVEMREWLAQGWSLVSEKCQEGAS